MLGHVGFMLGLYWVNWLYFGSYCSIHTGPRMIGASATVWYHLGLTNGHLHSSMHATMVEPKRTHKDVPRFAQTGTANQPTGNPIELGFHPANVRMATCLQCSQLGPTDWRIIWHIMLKTECTKVIPRLFLRRSPQKPMTSISLASHDTFQYKHWNHPLTKVWPHHEHNITFQQNVQQFICAPPLLH